MRLFVNLSFVIALSVLSVVSVVFVSAQQQGPPQISDETTSSIAFDWDGKFADGTDGAVASAVELQFVPVAGGTPVAYEESLNVVPGTNKVAAATAVEGLPNGQYNVRARIRSPSGKWSALSAPVVVEVDNRSPSSPINVRVEVQVTVNVGVGQ